MVLSLSGVCYIVAIVLFAVAAIPPAEPYHSRIVTIGLAFFAAGHVVA